MIYAPGRFLFIHIPRTGGVSMTATLARALLESTSLLVGTGNGPAPWSRHARAVDLKPVVPDWDQIPKFAVDRPLDEIVASDYRLHQRDAARVAAGEVRFELTWREQVLACQDLSLDEFRRQRWEIWMSGLTPWQYWCCDESGADLGVARFAFPLSAADWNALCDQIGAPRCALVHLNAGDGRRYFDAMGEALAPEIAPQGSFAMRLLSLEQFAPVFADLAGRRVGVVDGIGNTGDQLLYAATRQLLRAFQVPYQTINVLADSVQAGDFEALLLFAGGNMGYERCTAIRKAALQTGVPCILLPQSWILFETGPYWRVFARERASLEHWPAALLAPDLALGFEFPPSLGPPVFEQGLFLRRFGHALFAGRPGVSDPVDYCHTPEEYYRFAERYAHVITDRLHFAIAALGMGRRVTLLPVGYPKNRSLWETWLRDLGVEWAETPEEAPTTSCSAAAGGRI